MALMKITDFKNCLDTFKKDLEESGDMAGYSKATSRLIGDFYTDCIHKDQPDLVQEIIAFVTSL